MVNLREGLRIFMIVFCEILLKMKTNFVENQNQHILCLIILFFFKWCSLWRNVEKYGRTRQATDVNIIQRMRITCWIPKATDSHSEYVVLLHCSSGCTNVPHCNVACPVLCICKHVSGQNCGLCHGRFLAQPFLFIIPWSFGAVCYKRRWINTK